MFICLYILPGLVAPNQVAGPWPVAVMDLAARQTDDSLQADKVVPHSTTRASPWTRQTKVSVRGLCGIKMLRVVILEKYHSSTRLPVSERPN